MGYAKFELTKIEASFLTMQVVGLALVLQGLIMYYSPVKIDVTRGELEIQRSCKQVSLAKSGSMNIRFVDKFSVRNGVQLNVGQFESVVVGKKPIC